VVFDELRWFSDPPVLEMDAVGSVVTRTRERISPREYVPVTDQVRTFAVLDDEASGLLGVAIADLRSEH
jgi:hypothetical protein